MNKPPYMDGHSMNNPHLNGKHPQVASNLACEKPEPGKAARQWVYGLGLQRGELAVALAFAWYADAEGYCWPSRYSVAARAQYSIRSVQAMTENLIARGVLIEAGSKVTRTRTGLVVKRTRLYRLALGKLVPVMPATERRRLVRSIAGAAAKIESAKVALSNVPIESAKVALSTADPAANRKCNCCTLEPGRKCNFCTQSLVTTKGQPDAAREGAPLTPARAAPKDLPTTVKPVAAREADRAAKFVADIVPLLTPEQLAVTAERRARALTKISSRWWDAQPITLVSAADRPNRSPGRPKDWRAKP